jgi:hypothetical protein
MGCKYDEISRLTRISHNSPDGEFLKFEYTYDVNEAGNPIYKGLRTGITRTEDSVVVQEEHYSYDDLYRLAEVYREDAAATREERIVYSYDAVGNITNVITYYDGNGDGNLNEIKNRMDYAH